MNIGHFKLVSTTALVSKETIIEKALEELNELKILGYNSEEQFNKAAQNCLMVFIKYTQKDKSFKEIMSEFYETDNIASKAEELHNILTNNNIE